MTDARADGARGGNGLFDRAAFAGVAGDGRVPADGNGVEGGKAGAERPAMEPRIELQRGAIELEERVQVSAQLGPDEERGAAGGDTSQYGAFGGEAPSADGAARGGLKGRGPCEHGVGKRADEARADKG